MSETHDGQGEGATSGFSRWVSVSMVVLGAATAVIGLVFFLLPSDQASVGWFAYAPLSDTIFNPSGNLLTPQRQIGIVLLVLGSAVLSFGAGWALGRRHTAGRRHLPDTRGPDA